MNLNFDLNRQWNGNPSNGTCSNEKPKNSTEAIRIPDKPKRTGDLASNQWASSNSVFLPASLSVNNLDSSLSFHVAANNAHTSNSSLSSNCSAHNGNGQKSSQGNHPLFTMGNNHQHPHKGSLKLSSGSSLTSSQESGGNPMSPPTQGHFGVPGTRGSLGRRKEGLQLNFSSSAHVTPVRRRNVIASDSAATCASSGHTQLGGNVHSTINAHSQFDNYLNRELERQRREHYDQSRIERQHQQMKYYSSNGGSAKQRAKSVEAIRLLERASNSSATGDYNPPLQIPVGTSTTAMPGFQKTRNGNSGTHRSRNDLELEFSASVAVSNKTTTPSTFGNQDIDSVGGAGSDSAFSSAAQQISALGVLKIRGCKYRASKNDIIFKQALGAGVCGTVYKCEHRETGVKMAVKVMTVTGNRESDQQMFRDIQVNTLQHNCPYIVTSFGCLFTDQSIYICMEQMLTCLEKLLREKGAYFEEHILAKIAFSTLEALDYLKTKQSLIHRDIKPSNILVSESGVFKLCDFGICGKLINSNAATRSVGCVAYLAPERVEPNATYDVRADVWALGITIMELALQKYPYSKFETCSSEFEVLVMIKDEPAPRLPASPFSQQLRHFVELCVQKRREDRPKHKELLKHPFVQKSQMNEFDVAQWVRKYHPLDSDCNRQDTTKESHAPVVNGVSR